MRLSSALLYLALAPFSGAAEPVATPPSTEEPDLKETAIERLLSERDSIESFDAAVKDARKQGVSEQAILEARFLFHVDRQEDDAIAGLLPDFTKRGETFKIDESEIFSTREDWLAVTEYVSAIAALKKGDKNSFKKHITEAFWLSPRQGAAFAPHIDRLRLDEAMSGLKIDFAQKFTPLNGGDPIALEKILEGKKAVLFHFWSPWSRECEAGLPAIATAALSLEKEGISVVSLLLEDSAKALTDAREMIKPLGTPPAGVWLVDQKQSPLGRMLRVQSVPVIALVSSEGAVLFNGHFTDDELWKTLQKINSTIARPKLAEELEQP